MRHTEPGVRTIFNGPPDSCTPYIPRALKVLGFVEGMREYAGVGYYFNTVTLPDGATIKATSTAEGLKQLQITPPFGKEQETPDDREAFLFATRSADYKNIEVFRFFVDEFIGLSEEKHSEMQHYLEAGGWREDRQPLMSFRPYQHHDNDLPINPVPNMWCGMSGGTFATLVENRLWYHIDEGSDTEYYIDVGADRVATYEWKSRVGVGFGGEHPLAIAFGGGRLCVLMQIVDFSQSASVHPEAADVVWSARVDVYRRNVAEEEDDGVGFVLEKSFPVFTDKLPYERVLDRTQMHIANDHLVIGVDIAGLSGEGGRPSRSPEMFRYSLDTGERRGSVTGSATHWVMWPNISARNNHIAVAHHQERLLHIDLNTEKIRHVFYGEDMWDGIQNVSLTKGYIVYRGRSHTTGDHYLRFYHIQPQEQDAEELATQFELPSDVFFEIHPSYTQRTG